MGILTYKDDKFYMDGEPFVIVSGAIHYFRVHQDYWYDRLLKLKECGFNCVETYTCWNLHEPKEGEFNFSGMLDIEKYIDIAKELGLYVILRPGPYICAEWEFGGLPAWLLKYNDMELRCYDELYLSKVKRYFTELLDRLRSRLSINGGNIIMLQIENEYGSYGNDKKYLNAILNIYKELGMESLFFTSDGAENSMLTGGSLSGVLSTANFGSRPLIQKKIIDKYFPNQPFMCAEYWNGWFDHWGEEHHVRPKEEIIEDFKTFMNNDWSINVYMFHGGTNFNFWNGANHPGVYQPTVTSYDYGALLNEAGDRTEAYYKFREVLVEKFKDKVPPITAKDSEKFAYGKVCLTEQAKLFNNLDNLSKPIHVSAPKYMEDLGQNFGYILYRTTIKGPFDDWTLNIEHVHDRAQIFVNGVYQNTYSRWLKLENENKVRIPLDFNQNAKLDILVENMGRVNYGSKLRDRKGATGIKFCSQYSNQYHFGWDIYSLPMNDFSNLQFESVEDVKSIEPMFLRGHFEINDQPKDTFLKLDGFEKGFVVINGFNIGRYFDIGPQKTLYVPAPILKKGKNEIIVFESDKTSSLVVEFLDKPDLG